MSYDYFLWLTKRPVEAHEIDETTVKNWPDSTALRERIARLYPTLVWSTSGESADDCSGATSIGAVRLPSPDRDKDPLVIRTSHRVDSDGELKRLGEQLQCLVYDAQSGRIVFQPDAPADA